MSSLIVIFLPQKIKKYPKIQNPLRQLLKKMNEENMKKWLSEHP